MEITIILKNTEDSLVKRLDSRASDSAEKAGRVYKPVDYPGNPRV